jgi:signal transduction histidine kinase
MSAGAPVCDHPRGIRVTRSPGPGTVTGGGPISRGAQATRTPRGGGERGTAEPRPLFARSSNDRVIAGVAGGLAERLGVDPVVVRLAFVVLALAGGVGVVLYVVLWAIGRAETETRPAWRAGGDGQRTVAAVSIVIGVLLVLRSTHLWFGDALVWPVALAAVGSAIIWVRFDRSRARTRGADGRGGGRWGLTDATSTSFARLVVGGGLVVAGFAVFLASNISSGTVGAVLVALAVAVAGLALLGGPWIARLVRQLGDERTERVRVEEREEVAAHLHDSVLQTLALIQRSEDPGRMRALARVQERDLRGWLYRSDGAGDGTRNLVSDAVDAVTERIELAHGIRIDTVVVGDRPMDARVQAVVDACGEALTNAAKHSGADRVSLYVEVTDDDATAFVRDQGTGFDTEAVPADRRGIADSILGRMARNGGTAEIRSAPGEGTEIRLHVPRGDT